MGLREELKRSGELLLRVRRFGALGVSVDTRDRAWLKRLRKNSDLLQVYSWDVQLATDFPLLGELRKSLELRSWTGLRELLAEAQVELAGKYALQEPDKCRQPRAWMGLKRLLTDDELRATAATGERPELLPGPKHVYGWKSPKHPFAKDAVEILRELLGAFDDVVTDFIDDNSDADVNLAHRRLKQLNALEDAHWRLHYGTADEAKGARDQLIQVLGEIFAEPPHDLAAGIRKTADPWRPPGGTRAGGRTAFPRSLPALGEQLAGVFEQLRNDRIVREESKEARPAAIRLKYHVVLNFAEVDLREILAGAFSRRTNPRALARRVVAELFGVVPETVENAWRRLRDS